MFLKQVAKLIDLLFAVRPVKVFEGICERRTIPVKLTMFNHIYNQARYSVRLKRSQQSFLLTDTLGISHPISQLRHLNETNFI